VPADLCGCAHLALERAEAPAEVGSSRISRLCLIDSSLDDIVHGSTLGATDCQASLRLWLEGHSKRLEEVVARLLAQGFCIYLTSDHGHVEARGIGQPSEGLTVQSRGKRARVYGDRRAALNVQQAFAQTILWSQDGLLSDDLWVLMPERRMAFAPSNEIVVTHGGPTVDEVVVPLVTIMGSL
jgi:hypothetical protein